MDDWHAVVAVVPAMRGVWDSGRNGKFSAVNVSAGIATVAVVRDYGSMRAGAIQNSVATIAASDARWHLIFKKSAWPRVVIGRHKYPKIQTDTPIVTSRYWTSTLVWQTGKKLDTYVKIDVPVPIRVRHSCYVKKKIVVSLYSILNQTNRYTWNKIHVTLCVKGWTRPI